MQAKLRWLLLAIILLLGCGPAQLEPVHQADRIRDGSVIFWDCGPFTKPIHKHTGSTLTHAAIILYVGGDPWVYEAYPPRVRQLPLDVYLGKLEAKKARHPALSWFILQPREEFTSAELRAMKRHADAQLGRRYMIRGWWKGREVRGIMCSQLVGDVLEKSGRITSAHFRESPGSLYSKLKPLYE